MKSSIRHGGIVRCDMATVRETKDDMIFDDECEERHVAGVRRRRQVGVHRRRNGIVEVQVARSRELDDALAERG